ncbi:MAG: L,D-transpeptidase [candidate division KSB1 bacterium]|nr:L,D-transpeptidase [candidate division KSB1 bacterium]MDZ7303794.1 L,D-transpeptidase [candidate division KSB1 bacterium]MDZ7313053.1 L,D-transpeptidase [candidate division KSB1 bacterium]
MQNHAPRPPSFSKTPPEAKGRNANGAFTSKQAGDKAVASPLPTPHPIRKALLVGLGWGMTFALLTLLFAPVLREWTFAILPETKFSLQLRTMDLKKLQSEAQRLRKRVTSLRQRFDWFTPREPYLIVDTSENRIQVMVRNKEIHRGICSTGSYVLLKAGDERQWIFVTPRGMFRVLGKRERPVWAKPDWAFIEEGLPVPPQGAPERFEAGVLGEYALEIGDGYLIHGTLYKRMLGMPVTHGCVRLDDDDLRVVYRNLQIGSKVFIY